MGIGYNGRVNDPQAAPAEEGSAGPAPGAAGPTGRARTGGASAQANGASAPTGDASVQAGGASAPTDDGASAQADGPAARTDGGPARAPRPARRRNTAPPREDVLAAAMATIAERGLDGLTMAGLGRDVGMSSGHLLYYFRTKDELLLRTLEWSEGRLGAERGALLSRHDLPVAGRLAAYVELYVPDGPRDPHWTLWLEVWNRSQYAGDDARDRQAAIEGAWHRDLVALIAEGVSRGELRPVDPDRYAARLRALLDGFSVHVAVGLPGTGRAQVLAQVREHLAETLLSGS
ncbi:transcriptional regulator BetI [Streptomyces rubrolavendulae]|uniref:Transcriptional regulator BetI n=1 Tax=Streptomyces rubrolavendulae TaxID=285473 RepID=A0A1D8G6X4_9ACTN|nr:transcriptional regulator BetI [Streptomyces rubrolavendulae]